MAKSFFGGFFWPQLHKKGSDPYGAWMKYVVCLHLYIPWKFGERRSTPRGATGPSLSFFVCLFFLFVRHATMLGTETVLYVYALNLGGMGISPPDKRHTRAVFVFVLVLVLVLQQAATYSIAAVAGNWTILVYNCVCAVCSDAGSLLTWPQACIHAQYQDNAGQVPRKSHSFIHLPAYSLVWNIVVGLLNVYKPRFIFIFLINVEH